VKGFTDVLRLEVQELEKAPVVITLIQPSAVDTPFPEHARNYLAHEPQLPEPRIEPRRVAESILEAACHGGRDVTVGALAALNVAVAKVTPALADHAAARQAGRQQRDEPPLHPQGTLYQPGESGPAASGRVHGAD
jgi:short-subunit dehydrogenase